MADNIHIKKEYTYTIEQLTGVMKDMGVASNDFVLGAYKTYLEKLGYKMKEGCIFDVDNK